MFRLLIFGQLIVVLVFRSKSLGFVRFLLARREILPILPHPFGNFSERQLLMLQILANFYYKLAQEKKVFRPETLLLENMT